MSEYRIIHMCTDEDGIESHYLQEKRGKYWAIIEMFKSREDAERALKEKQK